MHTLHCARNVILCPDCEEPFPRSELKDHQIEIHSDKECGLCGLKVKAIDLKEHEDSLCPERIVQCQFCHLDSKAGELVQHEGYCGSRTEKCEECGDFVMLKDWEKHQKMALYHGKQRYL